MSGTTIDDADPTVAYNGNWASYSGWSTTYGGTSHESSSLDDRASLSFQGIGVLVNSGQQGIGWRARSSYAIDGGSPTVYSNDSYQSTTEAYRSPTLPNGQHTLTVINLDNRASLFIDSFLAFSPDDTTPPPSSTTSTSTATSTSVSSTSNFARSGTTTSSTSTTNSGFLVVNTTRSSTASTLSTPAVSSTPSPSSAEEPRDSRQILLIVVPISCAVVICSILMLYFLLRRRRKQQETDSLFTPAAFNNPMRFQPSMWENGQKPSAIIYDSNEPPPYVEDSSPSLTPNRQPAKFSTS